MVEFHDYFSLCLICLIFTIFIWKLSKLLHANHRLPPSPFALPIIGHLHLLVLSPSPHRAFHKLSIRYGPVFRLYLGSTPCVVVSSPETAKEIFKTHDYAFLDKPHNSSVDCISYGASALIFAPYGSYWKFMKKIVMSQLLNTRTLDILLPVRNDEINRLIKCLSQKANDGRSVELGLDLVKMTNNVISRMLMGKSKFNLSDHIWFCKNLDLQGFGKQSMDIHTRLDALLERVLREHLEARKQKKETGQLRDLLDILLDISEDENMEMKLTTDSIKAFILAGKDGNLNSVDMEEGIGLALPRANHLVCVPVARLHPIPLSAIERTI
ncbi:cytochrome P450 (chloroplast) [Artemisia annua]|uniref:Cytochrome P450 n=1 Tax=Artemisia annua TaxID=35608 RepID=A0A2U1PJX0_ARTAN|nr:cytochrome P450 [Artemisia annua]